MSAILPQMTRQTKESQHLKEEPTDVVRMWSRESQRETERERQEEGEGERERGFELE